MAVTEDNALTSLHQFIAATQPLQRSPDKIPLMDDIMGAMLQQIPAFNYPVCLRSNSTK
uniref:STAR_dimer domain-containing protein n=1 Tax=Angiostrongylus cantonensis TaxID=6313 RepID=A0A0K0DMZ6_ANGCA